MPIITIIDGVTITMYPEIGTRHSEPHVHARYNEDEASIDFNGNILAGKLPKKQESIVASWIKSHQSELAEQWERGQRGEHIERI